jgi:hypothetical protein
MPICQARKAERAVRRDGGPSFSSEERASRRRKANSIVRVSKDEKWLLTGSRVSVSDRRQGCANALRKIRRIVGRLRSLVDQGSPPQFVEWKRGIHTAGVIEVT